MKISLKRKLIIGAISISFSSILILMAIVSYIINNQNIQTSRNFLNQSFNVLLDNLSEREQHLLENTRQLASIKGVDSKTSYLSGEKSKVDVVHLVDMYRQLTAELYTVARIAQAWKVGIYDLDGDLLSFVVLSESEAFLGYLQGFPTPVFTVMSLKSGATITDQSWERIEEFPKVEAILPSHLPEQEVIQIKPIGQSLCLLAYVPIMGKMFSKESQQLELHQIGEAIAIQRLDEAFVNRLSNLTNTKVHIFAGDCLTAGDITEYQQLPPEILEQFVELADQTPQDSIIFDDITLQGNSYFQGILPLYADNTCVGAIAVLYSKAIAKAHTRQILKIFGGILFLSILVLVPIVALFSNSISKPIQQIVKEVHDGIAQGDLRKEIAIYREDEIGELADAFRQVTRKLNEVVTQMKSASDTMASGGQVMSVGMEEMSQGSIVQAEAAEEVTSSIGEMVANIKQNADNALQTKKIGMKASEDAQKSGKAVVEVVSKMKEIAGKVALIEDITSQTRMLSLNATIEATRVQEYGKGFAVVAAEVRGLADRSQSVATEITELVTSGVMFAEKASGMLTQLVPDIQKTAELVQEISAASSEQRAGAKQINASIQHLDRIIQQHSSLSEEMASMAEKLASQAEQLQSTIQFFKIDETPLISKEDTSQKKYGIKG